MTRHVLRSEGIIHSSLYMAGKKVGLSPATLAELIRAYSDVDFQRGIREGDKFEMFNIVVNEDDKIVRSDETYCGPHPKANARKSTALKMARVALNTSTKEATCPKGAYAHTNRRRTAEPGFGRRRHPILGYTKMHRGVDFAALAHPSTPLVTV